MDDQITVFNAGHQQTGRLDLGLALPAQIKTDGKTVGLEGGVTNAAEAETETGSPGKERPGQSQK